MIDIDISTDTPIINGDISTDIPEINGNLDTDGIDINNLRVRVTNLENNAVGVVDIGYDTTTSVLTLTTKNTKDEDIGTPRTITLPLGLTNITYDEENKKLIVTLSNNTIINVSLKESFDKIDRYITNLQTQIDELELKKLDKVAYISSSDIDNYFNN